MSQSPGHTRHRRRSPATEKARAIELRSFRQQVTRRRLERGMTLIEVMLAIAILATIVALTWGSISTSFTIRRASLERFERFRTVQMAMDRMSRELSMAFITNIGEVVTNDQREVEYKTIFLGEDDEITFTTFSHVQTRPGEVASEQCEVTYRVERVENEDGDYVRSLVRREDAPIDGDPEDGGVLYVLLPDVERVTFEYWDATREIAGDAWTRSWDASKDADMVLPERIRITVEIPHPTRNNETLEFVTQTQVALTQPIAILPAAIQEERDAMIQAIQEAAGVDPLNPNGGNLGPNTIDPVLSNPNQLVNPGGL